MAGPNGASLTVPAGALAQAVDLVIAQSSEGAPELPEGAEPAGAVYAITPHGTAFAVPVTVSIPFDAAQVPAGRSVQLLKADAGGSGWSPVAATVSGATLSAELSGLSWFLPQLVPTLPTITAQPVAASVTVGGSITFSVAAEANGAPPLSYQWVRDGADIAGATGDSYTLADVSFEDNGARFAVRVGNGLGLVTSAQAELEVLASCVRAMPGRVAMGNRFAAAVSADGRVWTWGRSSSDRQLGPGSTPDQDRLQPAPVTGVANAVAVYPLFDGFAVLRDDGRVLGWGSVFLQAGFSIDGPVTDGTALLDLTDVVQVAGGNSHTLALRADGTVWAWGSNVVGQLGNGSEPSASMIVQVSGLTGVTAIAAPDNASMAARSGSVWVWGQQTPDLCRGAGFDVLDTPVSVAGASGVNALSTGYLSLLWGQTGQLRGCGSAVPEVFPGSDTPQAVSVPSVASAASGGSYSFATNTVSPYILTLDAAGAVRGYSDPPAMASGVDALDQVCELSATGGSALFLRRDGSVWAWGDNDHGQLGDGTRTRRLTPVQVQGLNLN